MRAHTACAELQVVARLRVQRRERLVHQQHVRLHGERPRELRALLHPADSSCTYAFSNAVSSQLHSRSAIGAPFRLGTPRSFSPNSIFRAHVQHGTTRAPGTHARSRAIPGSARLEQRLPRTPYRCPPRCFNSATSRTPTVHEAYKLRGGTSSVTSSSAALSRAASRTASTHCAAPAAACSSSLCSQRQTEWPFIASHPVAFRSS